MTDPSLNCWALIPARGGSKSVPYKNIAELRGRPLIAYVIHAGLKCPEIEQVICSTDDQRIVDVCLELECNVDKRPNSLGQDDSRVADVIIEFIERNEGEGVKIPAFIALLQPTSPFINSDHITKCVEHLKSNPEHASVQTVISCPHNHHAINQRHVVDGVLDFVDQEARERAFNKQSKPKHFLFGNLVVFRTTKFIEQRTVFARPSAPLEIETLYGFDVDGPEDFKLAEAILNSRLVELDIETP